jgi:hypothetical protein
LEVLQRCFSETLGCNDSRILRFADTLPLGIPEDVKRAAEVGDAALLVIRGGATALAAALSESDPRSEGSRAAANDMVTQELEDNVHFTKKMIFRGRLVNKIARYTGVLGDHYVPESFEIDKDGVPKGDGGLTPFSQTPTIANMREALQIMLEKVGWEEKKIWAEVNQYYDVKKCSISFHSDNERKIVIGARFGQAAMPIAYGWWHKGKMVRNAQTGGWFSGSDPLMPGDMYIMSEIATGVGCKSGPRRILHLRHAAGGFGKAFIPNEWKKPKGSTVEEKKEIAEEGEALIV